LSETDSFIQEVTEEVRQDRMFALWKKWGPYVLGGVALIVGAAAYWNWTITQKEADAKVRGGTFLAADAENLEHQLALPEKIDGPAKLIAELTAAGALLDAGNHAEAITRYGAIATQPGLPVEYADLAALQAARAKAAAGETGGLVEALDALAGADRPYRLLAMELRAAVRISAGEVAIGHADLLAIMADPEATVGLRRRAEAVLTATGGNVADPSG
jgi:hypothetical protein